MPSGETAEKRRKMENAFESEISAQKPSNANI